MADKIACVITFYYREERKKFLERVINKLQNTSYNIDITVICNNPNTEYYYVGELEHPFHLPWKHIPVMQKYYDDSSYTHFIYTEDDVVIDQNNIDYWLYHRQEIDDKRFFPGFIRVEHLQNRWYLTDITRTYSIRDIKKYKSNYINLPENHQAMYIMDKIMMKEYLSCPASKEYAGTGKHEGILESSAEGLLYYNIPQGYYSRNLLHYSFSLIDPNCVIHHCSDSYVCNKDVPLSKLLINNLICN